MSSAQAQTISNSFLDDRVLNDTFPKIFHIYGSSIFDLLLSGVSEFSVEQVSENELSELRAVDSGEETEPASDRSFENVGQDTQQVAPVSGSPAERAPVTESHVDRNVSSTASVVQQGDYLLLNRTDLFFHQDLIQAG